MPPQWGPLFSFPNKPSKYRLTILLLEFGVFKRIKYLANCDDYFISSLI